MRYKLFLMDADNTLFDYVAAEMAALEKAFKEHGLSYGDDVLAAYRIINDSLWKELEAGRVSFEELKVARFERLLCEVGAGAVGAELFSQIYLRCLASCSQLMDGAEDVCRELVRRGGTLVLFTNGIADVQRPRLEASPIGKLFSAMAISEEMGLKKPDPRMTFAAMELVSHTERETVLVVGDSAADIGAAAGAGVDSCLVGNGNLITQPTYVINHLRDLLEISSL